MVLDLNADEWEVVSMFYIGEPNTTPLTPPEGAGWRLMAVNIVPLSNVNHRGRLLVENAIWARRRASNPYRNGADS